MEIISENKFLDRFEKGVAFFLIFFLLLLITTMIVVVAALFLRNVGDVLSAITTISDMQSAVMRSFSGVLLILLGLELLETVKVYCTHHRIRVETILTIALIALGRHVLIIDLHHTEASLLYGVAALIFALSLSYFLMKKGRLSDEVRAGD